MVIYHLIVEQAIILTEPLKYENDVPGGSPFGPTAVPAGSQDNDQMPLRSLARLFDQPSLGIAFVIMLFYSFLIFVFIYTVAGHIMLVNLPQPEPVPQAINDMMQQSGMPTFPAPTPAPDHQLATDNPEMRSTIVPAAAVAAAIIFIFWPIIAAGLHLLAKLADGEGSFGDTAAAIGYTYVPKIIAMILVIFTVAMMLPVFRIDVSNYHSGDIAKYIDISPGYSWAVKITTVVGLLCSSCLGAVAIWRIEKVSLSAAAFIVGIPLALYLLFTLL